MKEYNGFTEMVEDIANESEVKDLEEVFEEDYAPSGYEPFYYALYALGEIEA